MEFLYLGTASAEGIPAIFCDCPTCRRALAKGGKNIMTRAQALLDGRILFDLGADTYMHFLREGKTLANVTDIFITHSHSDHFTLTDIELRNPAYARNCPTQKLNVYVNAFLYQSLMRGEGLPLGGEIAHIREFVHFVQVEPFQPIRLGEYTVTPLPAKHTPLPEQSLLYFVEKDGKGIFYGNDTWIFGEEVDEYLAQNHKTIHLLSLDCTKADTKETYASHLSMAESATIIQRFRERGLMAENAKIYYTHFSHSSGYIFDELQEVAHKYNVEVAYDGLKIDI